MTRDCNCCPCCGDVRHQKRWAALSLIPAAPFLTPEEEAKLLDRIKTPLDIDTFSANDCWLCQDDNQYTATKVGSAPTPSHRASYQHFWGRDIPEGYVVNHLCENKSCINPDHLEAVTNGENIRYSAHRIRETWRIKREEEIANAKVFEAAAVTPWRAKKDAAVARARALPELEEDRIPRDQLIPYSPQR